MKPSLALAQHRSEIREIVLAHRAGNARVFGSVAKGLDTEESDLDILVDPLPNTSLLDLAKLQLSLEKQLGIHVDVLTPNALPENFRNQVLDNAIPV